MIDRQELMNRAVRPEAAKEILEQSEKRLADLLDAKKELETRAASLLTAFMTLALALIGAAGAFFTQTELVKANYRYLPIALILSALPMLFAAWSMIQALQPARYGNRGTEPSMWLIDNAIDAKLDPVPWIQATIAWDTQERIDTAAAANQEKASHISIGSSAVLASPLILFLAMLPQLSGTQ